MPKKYIKKNVKRGPKPKEPKIFTTSCTAVSNYEMMGYNGTEFNFASPSISVPANIIEQPYEWIEKSKTALKYFFSMKQTEHNQND